MAVLISTMCPLRQTGKLRPKIEGYSLERTLSLTQKNSKCNNLIVEKLNLFRVVLKTIKMSSPPFAMVYRLLLGY